MIQKKFYNKFGNEYFYQGDCYDTKKNFLNEMYYSDKCPNFNNNKDIIKFLIDRFNIDFSKKI